MEAIQGYEKEELNQMGHMMALTLTAHRIEFCDFLGEIAGENQLLNQNNGQFFTPSALSQMMAQMSVQNAAELIEQKGIITIADPAAGAGATLIATAKALYDQGIDPRSCAQFDAVDISRDAFHMCYIQLSLQGLQAMVRHGNSLTQEMWEHRPTPQLRYFDQDLRRYRAIEAMRQLIKDPTAFTEQVTSEEPTDPLSRTNEASTETSNSSTEKQQDFFNSTTFTGANDNASKPRRRQADVTVPEPQQLDLFGNVNDG